MISLMGSIWMLEISFNKNVIERKSYGNYEAVLEDNSLSKIAILDREPDDAYFQISDLEGYEYKFWKIPFWTTIKTVTLNF
jgi:hypothetical protein